MREINIPVLQFPKGIYLISNSLLCFLHRIFHEILPHGIFLRRSMRYPGTPYLYR